MYYAGLVVILLIDISVILTGKIYSNLSKFLYLILEYLFIFIPFVKDFYTFYMIQVYILDLN
jgi:hypothetical protein